MKTIGSIFLSALIGILLSQCAYCAENTGEVDLPQTLAELNRWYVEPPTNQNAATYFIQGFALLNLTTADATSSNLPFVGQFELTLTNTPLPEVVKNAAEEFLRHNQAAWPLLEEGAKHEKSRYPVDLNQGTETVYPHWSKIRSTLRVCELAAVVQADSRRGLEAAKSLQIGLALSRSVESEPSYVSQLLRVSCLTMVVDGLEQVLNRANLPPEALKNLQDTFGLNEKFESSGEGFSRSLAGERVVVLSAFDTARAEIINIMSNSPLSELLPVDELREQSIEASKADRSFFVQTMDAGLASWKKAYPQRLDVANVFSNRLVQLKDKPSLVLSRLFLPVTVSLVNREAQSVARLRLAQTALALERYRLVHDNHYPEVMSEIVPDYLPTIPRDPFTYGSLEYRKTKSGYLLYSVGPDRKDDSGSRKDDIVFQVVNPPSVITNHPSP